MENFHITRTGKHINFWLSEEDWKIFDDIRWENKLSISKTLRFLLEYYVNNNLKIEDNNDGYPY